MADSEHDATPLDDWLAAESRRPQDITAVFVQAGRALSALHDGGLVHGDFSAAAIEIGTDDRVTLRDHARGQAVGSPELAEGDGPDAKSDQYAFCAALYQAVVGRPAFDDDHERRRAQQLAMTVTWPHALPVNVGHVVLRGLSAEPRHRWPSMQRLLEALAEKRSHGRRTTVIGVVVSAGLAAVGVVAMNRPTCSDLDELRAQRWPDALRQRVRRSIEQTGGPLGMQTASRVQTRLDRWATDWATQRRSACAASTERRAAVACLERVGARFAALTERLADATDTRVLRAVSAASSLPPPRACSQGSAAPNTAAPNTVELELERARAASSLGDRDEALVLAQHALTSAESLDDPVSLGRALWLVGVLAPHERATEGRAQLQRAHVVLTEAGAEHDAARVSAALAAAWLAADDLDRATRWAEATVTAQERSAQTTAYERAALDALRGHIAVRLDLPDVALRFAGQAAASFAGASPHQVTALRQLAQAQRAMGDDDQANRTQTLADQTARDVFGDAHPLARPPAK